MPVDLILTMIFNMLLDFVENLVYSVCSQILMLICWDEWYKSFSDKYLVLHLASEVIFCFSSDNTTKLLR